MTAPSYVLEARGIAHRFGTVQALSDVTLRVSPGSVHCLLGDNGAGKSTLIKILSGAFKPSDGAVLVDGVEQTFRNPQDALDHGIATVFQDLAVVPIMPVYRNFFIAREPVKGRWPLRRFDREYAKDATRRALADIGIDLPDVTRPIMTLSGGQRQCVAIARAVHFGAKVLILDEPTSALGVRQAEIVLRYVAEARARGLGVILITHNAQHALPVGDEFTVLTRGRATGPLRRDELTAEELIRLMGGGAELDRLQRELQEDLRQVANGTTGADG
jgi:simple sugar transport system ATP-binding protein